MPKLSPPKINSVAQYRRFQRQMAAALFRPLTSASRMQRSWTDGRRMARVAEEFVKPNDRLNSFERLEIYNRQYWFRVLDCFYEDYPGLRGALGEKRFLKLAEAYLTRYPSRSFTLRNLGSRLEKFLRDEPEWTGSQLRLALDVVRFEWAQIVAFDGESKTPLNVATIAGINPAELRMQLQPYISLLALDFPVDDFVIAVKKHEALRGEASNAMDSAPKAARLKKVALPALEKVYVAVHRHNNALYYKRMESEEFALLSLIRKGFTVEEACHRALRRASKNTDWASKVQLWFENGSALGWFVPAGCQYLTEHKLKRNRRI